MLKIATKPETEEMNVFGVNGEHCRIIYCKLCTYCSSVITVEIEGAFEWWIKLWKVIIKETVLDEIKKLQSNA